MKIVSTTLLNRTIKSVADNKITISYGGSSSGKTICALIVLTLIAEQCEGLDIALVGRSIPVVKRNLIKDWKRVVMGNDFDYNRFNATDLIYTFDSGSKFRFLSGEDANKFLGYRCDYFLLDEANYMSESVFTQLFMRLGKKCIITFNPSKEFWITKLMTNPLAYSLHSTYKDNEYCPKEVANNLESLKDINEQFYKVYCLGEWGSVEGVVFDKFDFVDEMPEVYDSRFVGVDFGWTHPSAIIEVRFIGNKLYLHEVLFGSQLSNNQLAEAIKPLGDVLCYCDAANPKDITDLNIQGCSAIPFDKKAGIMYRIKAAHHCKIFITKSSENLIREMTNYSYQFDKLAEKYINYPVDRDNHTIDAWTYAATDYITYNLLYLQDENNNEPTKLLNRTPLY